MKAKHIVLMAAVLLLDQLSKWGVQASMQIDESIHVIPGFFRITYLHNTGAAWSMLEGKMVFFYLISIAFLIGMLIFYRSYRFQRSIDTHRRCPDDGGNSW